MRPTPHPLVRLLEAAFPTRDTPRGEIKFATGSQANAAAQAYFEAESVLDGLEDDLAALEIREIQLQATVDELRGQVELVALSRYVESGTEGIPLLTDVSERFLAAEMIREQVFRLTGEEIPYATAVTVDAFKEKSRGDLVKIEATIHLERDSQKGIVIGKSGSKLKQIGVQAREQIEHMLGTKVYLKLFVRVQKNWRKDTKAIRRFGY